MWRKSYTKPYTHHYPSCVYGGSCIKEYPHHYSSCVWGESCTKPFLHHHLSCVYDRSCTKPYLPNYLSCVRGEGALSYIPITVPALCVCVRGGGSWTKSQPHFYPSWVWERKLLKATTPSLSQLCKGSYTKPEPLHCHYPTSVCLERDAAISHNSITIPTVCVQRVI